MKKSKSENSKVKNFVINKSLFSILLLVSLSIIYILVHNAQIKKEIDENGYENKATVNYCEYFDYIDNAKSQKRIRFYRIKFSYAYKDKEFERTLELSPKEYKEKINRSLKQGDKINIKHAVDKPANVKIIK